MLAVFWVKSVSSHLCRGLAALLLLVAATLQVSAQQGNALTLTSDITDWAQIAPHVGYVQDNSRTADFDQMAARDYTPLPGQIADFGYTKAVNWLRFDLQNDTGLNDWRLAVNENFFQKFAVYYVDATGTMQVLDAQDEGSPYPSRSVESPQLTSAFTLAPGARSTLYIAFYSGGSSEITWRILSAPAFNDWTSRRTSKNFVFYGMVSILIIGASLAALTTRRGVFAAYGAYMLSALFFLAHADGTTFQYLWPNNPALNAYATVPIGLGLILSAATFARMFLQTKIYHPLMDRLLLATCVAGLALFAASFVVDTQPIKKYLIVMAMITTLLVALGGFIAARTRFREVRFYVIAWSGALLSSVLMTLRHWFGVEIPQEVQFDSMRAVLVVDAILMGLAIMDRINQLRKAHETALQQSLEQAQRSVSLSQRLLDLEDQMERTEELGVQRRQSLTDTVHDLRQPLNALRLNIRALSEQGAGAEAVAEVENTLGYLETLVSDELSHALREQNDPAPTVIGDTLNAVKDMFIADAEARGLSLSVIPSTLTTTTPPLAMMRIVANLVSNAIRITDQGGVVVGVRRDGGTRIEVHDTGPGLSQQTFEAAIAGQLAGPSDDANTNSGTGLGLSIVHALAEENGGRFTMMQKPSGTVMQVWLPA